MLKNILKALGLFITSPVIVGVLIGVLLIGIVMSLNNSVEASPQLQISPTGLSVQSQTVLGFDVLEDGFTGAFVSIVDPAQQEIVDPADIPVSFDTNFNITLIEKNTVYTFWMVDGENIISRGDTNVIIGTTPSDESDLRGFFAQDEAGDPFIEQLFHNIVNP